MEWKIRVVVVDDDIHILETVRNLLEPCGFEVFTRSTAVDSVDFIIRQNPHVILLDINLPWLSGDRLFEILKTQTELDHVPVIFFSSNDEARLRELVRETGAFGYISKSDMAHNFARRLGEMVERARISS